MAVDAGTIYSEIRIEIDKLKGDISNVEKRYQILGQNIESKSKKMEANTVDAFSKINLAGVAAFAGVGLAVKQSLSTFTSFTTGLSNVQSVAQASASELKALREAALEAGETTAFSASEATDALYALASAGLDATESTAALDGVLKLAGATGSDLALASQTVTAALSQYDLEAEKAIDVSNVFAAAISNSQANIQKLATAFRQVGPVAGTLGQSIEETTGSLQALFDAGFQGEQAGTILRNVLSRLADQSSTTVAKLEELGIAFEDVNPEMNTTGEIIGELESVGLSAGDAIAAFGQEAGPGLLTLLQTGQQGIEEYTNAVTGTNRASEAYAVQLDNLGGDVAIFRSTLESLAISFTQELEPALRGGVKFFTELLRIINLIPGPFKALIAVAIGAVPVIGGLSTAITLAGGAVAAVLPQITIIAGALAGLAAVAASAGTAWSGFQGRLNQPFEGVAEELGITARAARDVDNALSLGVGGALSMREVVIGLAESFNLSREQVLKIGLASKDITDETRSALKLELDRVEAQKQQREEISLEEAARKRVAAERQKALQEEERVLTSIQEKQSAIAGFITSSAESIRNELAALNELNNLGLVPKEELVQRELDLREQMVESLVREGIATGVTTEELQRQVLAQVRIINNLRQSQEETDKVGKTSKNLSKNIKDISSQTEEYELQLLRLVGTEEEVVEAERQRAIAAAKASGASKEAVALQIDAINNLYDQLVENINDGAGTAFDSFVDAAQDAVDRALPIFQQFTSAFNDLSDARLKNNIDNINTELETTIESLNQQLESRLRAAGVAEKTEIESLQSRLDAAITAGEAETASELRSEIERLRIKQEFEDEITAAEEEAAKERAQIEYEAALNSYRVNLANAIANAASALIRNFAELGFIAGGLANIPTAIATGVQIAAIRESKPEPPSFATGGLVIPKAGVQSITNIQNNAARNMQTGGIVVPSGSDGTLVRAAENGAPELLLNGGASGVQFLDAFADRIAARDGKGSGVIKIEIPLNIDGKKVAMSSAEYYNNGQVRLT